MKWSKTPLTLHAETAQNLMTPNPVVISVDTTIKEAAALLVDNEIGAVPVVDEECRAIGVLSHTDIVRFERERVLYTTPNPDAEATETEPEINQLTDSGFQVEQTDQKTIKDLMTPWVIWVSPDTSAQKVIRKFLEHRIHHLYVEDTYGKLVGVISPLDILAHLETDETEREEPMF